MQLTQQKQAPQHLKTQSENTSNSNINAQLIRNSEKARMLKPVVGLVHNDSSRSSLKALTFIKELISSQLPKMPKSYITKLLFDERHQCLYLESDGKIVGVACFRCFKDKIFVQLVFLAVAQGFRECGLGTKIIDNLKKLLQERQKALLLTYADQTAVGFFKKQAFYFAVQNSSKQWAEYIQAYEGGRLMQCQVDKHLNYAQFRNIIKFQRQCLAKKLELIYHSQANYSLKVLDNLLTRNKNLNLEANNQQNNIFEGETGQRDSSIYSKIDFDLVPGVLDNRWSKQKESELQLQKQTSLMLEQLSALQLIRKLPLLRIIQGIEYPKEFRPELTLSIIQKKITNNSFDNSKELAKDIKSLINQWKRFCSTEEIKSVQDLQKKIESILGLLISRKLDLRSGRKSKQPKDKINKQTLKR